jgi:hypothetical protein
LEVAQKACVGRRIIARVRPARAGQLEERWRRPAGGVDFAAQYIVQMAGMPPPLCEAAHDF